MKLKYASVATDPTGAKLKYPSVVADLTAVNLKYTSVVTQLDRMYNQMIEDQDFLIRQIKTMVKGLGKFMGLEQIKEILNLNEAQQEMLTGESFESIVVMTKVENIAHQAQLSIDDLSRQLDIPNDRLHDLLDNEEYATSDELTRLNIFIDENQKHL